MVETEKEARTIVAEREENKKNARVANIVAVTLEKCLNASKKAKARELRLIVKADVQGSLEPIISSLEEISASR